MKRNLMDELKEGIEALAKNNIKPCPFCGGEDLTFQTSTEDREGVPANIICQDCGCAGPWEYIKREAIDNAWENNTIPSKLIELWNGRK
jgi:Lar family restriction alleviation protein